MRERLAARTLSPGDEPLEESVLRRQLEGGVEQLEEALERYRQLTAALQARRWKQKLRRQPTLLAETVAGETALAEVIPRLQRRAEREPESAEFAGRLLRRLEEERARLTSALNRRLPSASSGTLAERLEQLAAVALEPLPLPPGEGEVRLLEGNSWLPPFGAWQLFLPVWALLAYTAGWWLAVPLLAAFCLFFHARSGRYWLTSERLIWQPRWSDPVEVRLASIGEGQLRLSRLSGSVTVGEQSPLTLRHVPRAETLAALLSIRRRKEFRDAAATRDPRRLAALLDMLPVPPGRLMNPESAHWGCAVLRPDFVAFFEDGGDRLLDAITEPSGPTNRYAWLPRDEVPIPVRLLLEQLLLLPEERMDAMLRKAPQAEAPSFTRTPTVFFWEARALRWKLQSFFSLRLSSGDKELHGYLSWSGHHLAEQLIAQWKARQDAKPGSSV